MGEIQQAILAIQALTEKSDLARAELGALQFLDRLGFESLNEPHGMATDNKDRWAAWAAESVVWTVRRIERGEWVLALRGWGTIREEQGRNGGLLPIFFSDHVRGTIQRALEDQIGGAR